MWSLMKIKTIMTQRRNLECRSFYVQLNWSPTVTSVLLHTVFL
jgi:hypothetical protein